MSYRNLSMIARQMKASSPEEREKNIEKGVTFAKAALELDAMDGQSWAVLGNAHFSTFFNIKQHPRTLKQAISAYDTAVRKFPFLLRMHFFKVKIK